MKSETQETVTTTDDAGIREGRPGKSLYRIPRMQIISLALFLTYTVTILAFSILVLCRCPSHSQWYRVLPTGNLKVDQFYSGITLSIVFTLAAIITRRLSYGVALLYPFALASKSPIAIADLDILSDPGVAALRRLFTYSRGRVSAQSLIMLVGAFLVLIGTLLICPGTYAAPDAGMAPVGLPTAFHGMMIMSIAMQKTAKTLLVDFFLETATDVFVGNTISEMRASRPLPSKFGPVATSNLTYLEGVTYSGLLTYTWSSGCVTANDQIHFTEQTTPHLWLFNITMPDGSSCINMPAWDTGLCVSNTSDSEQQLTSVSYAIVGTLGKTLNLANVTKQSNSTITLKNDTWISRVTCTPRLDWEASNCTYLNGTMTNCVPAPGRNTTQLDVVGLNRLSQYMSAVPLNVANPHKYTFGYKTILLPLVFDSQTTTNYQYRAPTLQDCDNMYGNIAHSIVISITAGYYGVAEVPVTGSSPSPVYLVWLYILLIVAFLLVLCPIAPLITILNNIYVQKVPVRRTGFLTIANAVRGPWWDKILCGTCLTSPAEARQTLRRIKVMFGIPVDHDHMFVQNRHVGLSERVDPVNETDYYFGVST